MMCVYTCTHTQTHTSTTSIGEDYEYYWNKNTHFYLTMIPTMCLGMCLLELALPIVFFFYVQEALCSKGSHTGFSWG